MTVITPEDDTFDLEFLREFPIPHVDDTEWIKDIEESLSCQECEYYNDNILLPCAVNPSNIYQANDCQDYSEK